MSTLEKIAYFQGRRDEVPNQLLAKELAETRNVQGIAEIAENLENKKKNVRSDCLKVLYEIGYLRPELIAPYAGDFLKLLESRNNRLVWGGIIALSTIAEIAADEVYPHVAEIQRTMEGGSVITVDSGIRTLARLAGTSYERRATLFPYLISHLRTCRPSDVPRHAEMILGAVRGDNKDEFRAVLQARMPQITPAQAARLKKVVRQAEAR